MLSSQTVDLEKLTGYLYLHAVLTALEDLVKHIPGAQRIVGDQQFSVLIECLENPRSLLLILIKSGRVVVHSVENEGERANVHLVFKDYGSIETFFSGKGFTLPSVEKGWEEPWQLVTIVRLLLSMKRYLEPSHRRIQRSTQVAIAHTRLLLGVALNCLKILAEREPFSQSILRSLPEGLAVFSIEKESFSAWVDWSAGQLRFGRGIPKKREADVELVFRDANAAMSIFKAKIPSLEAVGKGDIRISGMLPLADGLGQILDRVNRYIKTV